MGAARIACVLLLGVSLVGDALCEPRTTTVAVTIRKKPGEKEPALASLPPGTAVEVVKEEGRWLRVRANGVEGYVTRTTVTAADGAAPAAPPTAVWSAPRRQNGAEIVDLFVVVTVDTAPLRATAKTSAAPVADVARGGRLAVLDAAKDPAWIHARDGEGHEGWISRAHVDNGATAVTVTGKDLEGSESTNYTRPASKSFAIRTELGLGYRSVGMDLTSNAAGGLTNYLVDADAVALTIGTTVTKQLEKRGFAAGDLRLQLGDASPGIDYPGPTGPAGKIPFRTFSAELGARAGLRAKQVLEVAMRLAGHYDAFLPRDVDNAGMLPRESLLGATFGVDVQILPRHSPISAELRADVLLIGKRAQTKGLEDGTSSKARAVWGGLTVRYQVGRRWAVIGGYEFGRASTSWSGMSVREPGVTNAHRVDTTQLLSLGLGAEL